MFYYTDSQNIHQQYFLWSKFFLFKEERISSYQNLRNKEYDDIYNYEYY